MDQLQINQPKLSKKTKDDVKAIIKGIVEKNNTIGNGSQDLVDKSVVKLSGIRQWGEYVRTKIKNFSRSAEDIAKDVYDKKKEWHNKLYAKGNEGMLHDYLGKTMSNNNHFKDYLRTDYRHLNGDHSLYENSDNFLNDLANAHKKEGFDAWHNSLDETARSYYDGAKSEADSVATAASRAKHRNDMTKMMGYGALGIGGAYALKPNNGVHITKV